MRVLLSAIVSLCLMVPSAFASKPAPAEHFGHLPMLQNVALSPDGKTVAALFNSPNGPQVVVAPFGSQQVTPIAQLQKNIDRIEDIVWQNNERLLIWTSQSTLLGGQRYRVNRLFTVSKEGKDVSQVKKKVLRKKTSSMLASFYSDINLLSILPDDPDHVLLELWSERDEAYAVFKVNPEDNDFEKVLVNDMDVQDWWATPKGVINFGSSYKWKPSAQKYEEVYYHRTSNDKPFREVYRGLVEDRGKFAIAGVIGDKMFVISDREIGREALWQYDIPSAKYEKIVYSHDKYDITGAILNRDETKIIGVQYADDYIRSHYFDGNISKRRQFIDAAFQGYITSIAAVSQDENKVMVRAQRNNMATQFFWVDLSTNKGGMWFSQFPYLAQTQLAHTNSFQFKASDGLEIGGYLTLPVATTDKLPKLIVFPHGGPRARDYQYFDPWVQFMANRGYAVLQLNFRGSTGFGSNFEVAGYREWGRRMQQDIYDVVEWIGKQSIVDTDKACLVGGSYGGYVALTASFQKPDMFDCIVSIAGISDLTEMATQDYKRHTWRHIVRVTIGDPTTEAGKKQMDQVSAINHLDKIKAPILLIHGTYDTRVPYTQSSRFYEAAKAKDLDVQYLELEYGTHHLDENDNRKAAFMAIDKFLSKHL